MSASDPTPSRARTARGARRGALAAILGLLALALVAPAPAMALKLRPCAADAQFGCGTLTVPLDHSGAAKGKVRLALAAKRSFPKGGRVLIALTGGPGQSAVDGVGSFAAVLEPALKRYRLVVYDQRGTGLSGALRCDRLQRTGALAEIPPSSVGACLRSLGARRSFYSTADSVRDIEAIRRALGVRKVAVLGISYGTWVAQEYARTYPERTDRLVLDSPVSPNALDAFGLNSARSFKRVVDEICAKGACRGATSDHYGDIADAARRLRRARIRGTIFDTRGRPLKAQIAREDQLWGIVTSVDLNPNMLARMPGALAAARAGDDRPLLRLRRIAEGPPATPTREFSWALFYTTLCLDSALPFPLTADLAGRTAAVRRAFAQVPASDYAPWAPDVFLDSSTAMACTQFPRQARVPPRPGPLPKVPTLILSGRADMRTPTEQAREVQRLIPGSDLVTVGGTGHDVEDTDITGCVNRAFDRFFNGRRVGAPCTGKTNAVPVLPKPPASLAAVPTAPGTPGTRGRVARAALITAQEAGFSVVEAAFSGFNAWAGGLRGGSARAEDPFAGPLRLRDYTYVPGVRLSGELQVLGNSLRGTLRVRGPVSGRITLLGRSRARGVLGGRAFSFRLGPARRSSADGAGAAIPPLPRGLAERLRDRAAPPLR